MINKNYFLLVLFLSFKILLYSQEIVDPLKLWSNMEEHCQPWGSTYSTDFFRFDNDTTIDEKLYKKVWIAEDEDHQEWNFYGAFIREDDSRVYYREMFAEEGLIYDFNLEIGDSVIVNNPRTTSELVLFLTEIDSVELVDGYRERWKLISNNYQNAEYWIRGIGSQTGVINSGSGVFGGLCGLFTLLCEKEEDVLIYQNPEFGSCYLFTTDIKNNDIDNAPFLLSYNSSSKTVNLKMADRQNRVLILSNLTGKIIERKQTSDASVLFNVSGYLEGLYIITVIQESKLYSEKLIVY